MAGHSHSGTRARRGEVEGLVRDEDGREYVAVHPIYSRPRGTRKCILWSRIAVCILSLLVLLFAIIGLVIPYATYKKPGSTKKTTYTFWKEITTESGKAAKPKDREVSSAISSGRACAVLTIICSFFSLVLGIVFAIYFYRDEKIRFDEEDANEKLQAKYGVERAGSHTSEESFPYENRCIPNDRVDRIPFEHAEVRRRRTNRIIGTILFFLLLLTFIFAVVTTGMMGQDYDKYISKEEDKGNAYDGGLGLYIVALFLALVACVLVAIPPVSGLNLCYAPKLRRAQLMVIDESDEAATASEMRQRPAVERQGQHEVSVEGAYNSTTTRDSDACGGKGGRKNSPSYSNNSRPQYLVPQPPPPQNPFYPPANGEVPTQMAVARGIPVALPGPPMESLPQTCTDSTDQRASEYTNGTYYEAPPQLFNLSNANNKCKPA